MLVLIIFNAILLVLDAEITDTMDESNHVSIYIDFSGEFPSYFRNTVSQQSSNLLTIDERSLYYIWVSGVRAG